MSRGTRDRLLLALAAALLVLPGLGLRDLWNPDEARYGEVAREMRETGERWVPHLNGERYTEKPPLFFWAIAAASLPGGEVTETAVRLPSALAAIGTLLLVFGIGERRFGRRAAWLAAAALGTSWTVVWHARFGQIDMLLTFLVTLGVWCWTREQWDGRRWWALGFFAATGLATVAKGPAGFLPPLLAILAFLALTRDREGFRRLRLGRGLLLWAAVVLGWLVPASLAAGPGYWQAMIFKQTLTRYAEPWHHQQPWYYYLTVIPADFFPWAFLLPAALVAGWRGLMRPWRDGGREESGEKKKGKREELGGESGAGLASRAGDAPLVAAAMTPGGAAPEAGPGIGPASDRRQAEGSELSRGAVDSEHASSRAPGSGSRRSPAASGFLFALCWMVVTVVFFSVSPAKRTVYILTMYPAMALIVGAGLDVLARKAAAARIPSDAAGAADAELAAGAHAAAYPAPSPEPSDEPQTAAGGSVTAYPASALAPPADTRASGEPDSHPAIRRRSSRWLTWPLGLLAALLVGLAAAAPPVGLRRPELAVLGRGFLWALTAALAVLAAAAVWAWWSAVRGRVGRAAAALAGGMAALALVANLYLLPRFDVFKSARPLAAELTARMAPGESYGIYPKLDAPFVFYTRRFAVPLTTPDELAAFLARPGRGWVLAERDDWARLTDPPPLVEVAREPESKEGYLLLAERE